VEFKSTLERGLERRMDRLKEAGRNGYEEPPEVKEVFKLIVNSEAYPVAGLRTMTIAKETQPSIADTDLKISSDMQLAMASELILNLIKEGLISINK
jgi:hypothetical protein